MGMQGDQGPQGDQGIPGNDGAQGPQGIQGEQGPAGSDASVTSANITSALGFTPDAPTAPRTPTAHTHAVTDVTGLQSALDGKQPAGSYATAAQGAKADTALQPGTAISSVSGLQTALDGKQAAGTYATLVGGTVPSSQLPSYVDDVLEFATLAAFPATGETGKIYVATIPNKTYRWSGTAYVEIASSPGSTDAVTEGSINLYFTAARAVSALASTLSSYATKAWVTAQGFATTAGVSSAISALVTGVSSVAGKTGDVTLVKADIGLGNVDNTSDANKPISTATQIALDGKQVAGSYAPATGIAPSAITGTAVITTDSRLADARTPSAHTHSAAEITSGTLALARLDPLVSLDNVNNNFSVNQTFAGTNNTAPNQTAASGSSLMTRGLVDGRIASGGVMFYPIDLITSANTSVASGAQVRAGNSTADLTFWGSSVAGSSAASITQPWLPYVTNDGDALPQGGYGAINLRKPHVLTTSFFFATTGATDIVARIGLGAVGQASGVISVVSSYTGYALRIWRNNATTWNGAIQCRTFPLHNSGISGATNASPIVITTNANHNFVTGDQVEITGIVGNTAANGIRTVTVLSATTFSLNGSTGNGAYTSGGSVVKQSPSFTFSAGFIRRAFFVYDGNGNVALYFGSVSGTPLATISGMGTNPLGEIIGSQNMQFHAGIQSITDATAWNGMGVSNAGFIF